MKNFFRFVLVSAILIIFPLSAYFVIESSGATITTSTDKVVYDLPYPGIMADHPLYFIKIVRDRITEFLTRDSLKKAQLYLLYSDKRAAMALNLAQKGKNKQAIDAISKAEKYFLKIPDLLKTAKKQGGSAPSSFVETVKLSNAKHKELIDQLVKTLPIGLNESLNQVSALNTEIKSLLESL